LEKLELHISQVNSKLQTLLKRYSVLQKQTVQQQEQIEMLKSQLEGNEQKIKALEEQQYILKAAAGSLNATDKKAFEQTIAKYIREIDKCIALLSE
jgi:chromosome segregation ATPase